MLARLILVLLLAAFSLPAAAASCHDAPAPAAHAMAGHGGSHRDVPPPERMAAHACVGCVPPSDLLGARVAEPVVTPVPAPLARVASLRLGRASPPALPPPRQG